MRRRTICCAVALGLSGAGCAAVTESAHGTAYWTRRAIDDARERHRNDALAARAWAAASQTAACRGAPADYAEGFKAGFADHLYRGTSVPPPLPPKQYRGLRYQTPEGFRAGADWLAGFRHGVEDARGSGLRQLVTGPSSLGVTPAAAAPDPAPGVTEAPGDPLPPPRLLDERAPPPPPPRVDVTPPAVVESVETVGAKPPTPPIPAAPLVHAVVPARAVEPVETGRTPHVVTCGYVGSVGLMRSRTHEPPPGLPPPRRLPPLAVSGTVGEARGAVRWESAGTLLPPALPVMWSPPAGGAANEWSAGGPAR